MGLMDVQEHIETQNASHVASDGLRERGFMNPRKLDEIHAEFCRENNMTQAQLRKLLSHTKIESTHSTDDATPTRKRKKKKKTQTQTTTQSVAAAPPSPLHSKMKQSPSHAQNNVQYGVNYGQTQSAYGEFDGEATAFSFAATNPYALPPDRYEQCYPQVNAVQSNPRKFPPAQHEYPWHTPPRFQRMRQQQRLEKQQQKQQQGQTPKGQSKKAEKRKKRKEKRDPKLVERERERAERKRESKKKMTQTQTQQQTQTQSQTPNHSNSRTKATRQSPEKSSNPNLWASRVRKVKTAPSGPLYLHNTH